MDAYFMTERHRQLRTEVRAFAETEVRPRIEEMESSRAVQHDLSRLIARQGWIGVTIGAEHGGLGLGHLAKTIIIEELARVSGAMGAMVQASQLGVAKILHFGDEAQRAAWLPAIAAGDCLPTIAVTEEQSGGHVLGMTATAVRDGDDYLLNGRKVFVGNSHVGDLHGVVVRTGPGSRGLSAFLVEADRPGFSLGPHRAAMGLHGFSFGELIFDNCRIPATNRLGAEGDGLSVAYSSSILYGRPNLTAVALGIHRALVEETSAYVTERHRYGRPLGELLPIKLKLGQMQSRLMTARLAAYHAVHTLDQGLPCDPELMNAKLINVESALDSARNAMEIHAAAGLYLNRPVERYLRDAHHIFAPAGTSDVQLIRLAEFALGTAKGQWSQRLAPQTPAGSALAGSALAGSAHAGSALAGLAHAGSAHDGLAHAGSAHDGLAHAGSAHAGLAHAGSAHDGLAHAGSAHDSLAHAGSVQAAGIAQGAGAAQAVRVADVAAAAEAAQAARVAGPAVGEVRAADPDAAGVVEAA